MNVNSRIFFLCENTDPRNTGTVDWDTGHDLWESIEATELGEHRLSKDFIKNQLAKDFGTNPKINRAL